MREPCSQHCAMHLFDDDDVLQEYQDHHSEEEDGDLYEKIACADAAREDKRRCKSHGRCHRFDPV